MKTFPRRPDGTRKPKFETPEDVTRAFDAYMEWLEENPHVVLDKHLVVNGVVTAAEKTLARSPTRQSWCRYLGITKQGWHHIRKQEHLADVCLEIDEEIDSHIIDLALVERVNPGFAARLTGLAEKTDHVSSDGSMTPKGRTLDDFYKEPDVPAKSSAS